MPVVLQQKKKKVAAAVDSFLASAEATDKNKKE